MIALDRAKLVEAAQMDSQGNNGVRSVRRVRAVIGHWKKKLRFFQEKLGGMVPKGGISNPSILQCFSGPFQIP
jgi:hypothetical protein